MNTAAGTLEHIDPATLVVAQNVRATVTLDEEFLASIRANGVLVPIVASRTADGAISVQYGQRRTLAAKEVGLENVPVYLVPVDEADNAERIVRQLVENDQRADITQAERLDAWKALELEGLSATAIAKRTGTKRATIKTGLTVAASDTGTRLIGEVGLTLDQAAILLEFEDSPETVDELTRSATEEPEYFPHAVQRARDDRASAQAREAGEQAEAAKGHRILSERPGWSEDRPARLRQVHDADGNAVDADAIQGKEGVAVYVTGQRDGTHSVTYYLDDPAALGYTAPAESSHSQSSSGPMTDEQKAERKTLIANNKDWDASETVRREWLATFLSRKTLPKDTAQVIARALTGSRHAVSTALSQGNSLAVNLLTIETEAGSYGDPFSDYLDAHPTKAQHVTLAITLGGMEENTSRNSWRYPDARTARYFQTLAAWGYTLSPVEKTAAMIQDDTPTE